MTPRGSGPEHEDGQGPGAPDFLALDARVQPRAVGPHTDAPSVAPRASAERRPVEPWEQPYLDALGTALRALRRDAGLTQADLAWRAGLAERSLRRIEHGQRRTRRSTLSRLVVGLLPSAADGTAAAELEEALVLTAGPALAPESAYKERVQARRDRRRRRAASRYVTQHTVQYRAHPEGVLEMHTHSRRTGRESTRDRHYRRLRLHDGSLRRVPVAAEGQPPAPARRFGVGRDERPRAR